jgi:hypothetical protein
MPFWSCTTTGDNATGDAAAGDGLEARSVAPTRTLQVRRLMGSAGRGASVGSFIDVSPPMAETDVALRQHPMCQREGAENPWLFARGAEAFGIQIRSAHGSGKM